MHKSRTTLRVFLLASFLATAAQSQTVKIESYMKAAEGRGLDASYPCQATNFADGPVCDSICAEIPEGKQVKDVSVFAKKWTHPDSGAFQPCGSVNKPGVCQSLSARYESNDWKADKRRYCVKVKNWGAARLTTRMVLELEPASK